MRRYIGEITIKGNRVKVPTIEVGKHEIIVAGKYLKIARLKEEWDDDIENPEWVIDELNKSHERIDIFTFMQRLPESSPRYKYWMEWDNVAAIPIRSYERWFESQLHSSHRNKVRKAQREGVTIKQVPFDDDFVSSVMKVLNESPVRQGGPFLDYGKSFDIVKMEHATYLDRAEFIGAYYADELIGYIKLVFAGKFMRTMQILSMIKHRAKAPTNALLAEAIKICVERQIPYLVYGKYSYGKVGSDTLREFKFYNGFEPIMLPRYYIPVTPLGKFAIKCGAHKGMIGLMPRSLVKLLLAIRKEIYDRKA